MCQDKVTLGDKSTVFLIGDGWRQEGFPIFPAGRKRHAADPPDLYSELECEGPGKFRYVLLQN